MDYLFSMHPQHAENIFSGAKTVELRSRRIQINGPGRIWIYVTTPMKEIAGVARISGVEIAKPSVIWSQFSRDICISRGEFDDYVGGRTAVSAIVIEGATRFKSPIGLERLKQLIPKFHPPQFYLDLSTKKEFRGALKKESREFAMLA